MSDAEYDHVGPMDVDDGAAAGKPLFFAGVDGFVILPFRFCIPCLWAGHFVLSFFLLSHRQL